MITTPPFFDNAIEAVISEFKPNLIILDLLLEEDIESGLHVLRKLKCSKSLSCVPAVVCSKFVSSRLDDDTRRRVLALGAIEAFPKIPFPKAIDFLKYASSVEDQDL